MLENEKHKVFQKSPDLNQSLELLLQIHQNKEVLLPSFVDKPLALYGAGDFGKMAYEYFKRLGISIAFVVDQNKDSYIDDPFWKGVILYHPSEVSGVDKRSHLLAICITKIPYYPLVNQLYQQGWADCKPTYDILEYYKDQHPLSNGWFADPFTDEDLKNIQFVLKHLSDDMSRAHYLYFLAWRRLREEWIFLDAPITPGNRYFIPEVQQRLGNNETFVDIGAHEGQTAKRFIDQVNGKYNKIYCIEPDPDNLLTLKENLKGKNNVEIMYYALNDVAIPKSFITNYGYASQFSSSGNITLNTMTLDELNLNPTFIKMHIEGHELNALKGAIKTLQKHRPLLALTSYHNQLGIWELPMWMMNNFDDYSFRMHHHSYLGTTCVIYGFSN